MNIRTIDPDRYYVFEGRTMTELRKVMDRLYSMEPLVPNDRRDLAQRLHALLERAEEFDSGEK